jgi:hypothetical protein
MSANTLQPDGIYDRMERVVEKECSNSEAILRMPVSQSKKIFGFDRLVISVLSDFHLLQITEVLADYKGIMQTQPNLERSLAM